MSAPGTPARAQFTLNVGGTVVRATLERSDDGAMVARLEIDGPPPLLNRPNVAALREMLGQVQRALLESEWDQRTDRGPA